MIFGLKSRKKPASYEAGEKIIYINPADIIPNNDQPRKYFDENGILRLADSIRRYGMIHPLTVRVPDPDETATRAEVDGGNTVPGGSEKANGTSPRSSTPQAAAQAPGQAGATPPQPSQRSGLFRDSSCRGDSFLDGSSRGNSFRGDGFRGGSDIDAAAESGRTVYMLISGERRYRAALMLGLSAVPCIVKSYDDSQSATVSIVENLLRRDLNMFEQAKAFEKLIAEYGLTQSEVAERLSTSQSCVANKLRLMKLSDDEQNYIIENGLTERHARALLRITDIPLRKAAMMAIADKKLNVSSAESYIERLVGTLNCQKAENGAGVAADSQKAAQIDVCDSSVVDSGINNTANGGLETSEDNISAQYENSKENADDSDRNNNPDAGSSDNPGENGDKSSHGATYTPILPADDYKKKLSGAFGRIFRQMPVETSVSAENDDEIVFTVTVRKNKMA